MGLKGKLEGYDRRSLALVHGADPSVLGFITGMMSHAAGTEEEYEVLRRTFMDGYCWQFAHLLMDVFGRGEVCWAAPFSHFVWVDENGVAYDAEGINQGEQAHNIPESYLGEYAEGFRHIPDRAVPAITQDKIIDIIRDYEYDGNLPPADLGYYFSSQT